MVDQIPEHIRKESNRIWTRMARTYAHVLGLPGPECLAQGAYIVIGLYDGFRAGEWAYRFYEGTIGDQNRFRQFTLGMEHFTSEVRHLQQLATEDWGVL